MTDTLLRLYRPVVWLCGAILILMALAIATEVIVRKAFDLSLGGVDELSGYGFAIFSSFAFSFAALKKANIRIEAVYYALPVRCRVALDILALASLVLLAGLLAWGAAVLALDSYQTGRTAITPLATRLVYPQAIWAAGFALFAFVVGLIAVASIKELARRNLDAFFCLSGPLSEMAAADEELGQLARKPSGD